MKVLAYWLCMSRDLLHIFVLMSLANESKYIKASHYKSVLEMSSDKARAFFLKGDSYFTLELPIYFKFDGILNAMYEELEGIEPQEILNLIKEAKKKENVNYVIYTNKDGRYAWRAVQLIHPVLYVGLVHYITEDKTWEYITNRVKRMLSVAEKLNILCRGMPKEETESHTTRGTQILSWWEEVEQESIRLALEYEYMLTADIANFYDSIYTHTIPWALHGREQAKKNRSDEHLIGNVIDQFLQAMNYGQTNGIPTGSILMDFIAEILLCCVDVTVGRKLRIKGQYKILRYRDDYRIFVNDPSIGDKIVQALSAALREVGLRLNSEKTKAPHRVIAGALKEAKWAWIRRLPPPEDLLSHLLAIYEHSESYSNSGSVVTALTKFDKIISKIIGYRGNKYKKINNIRILSKGAEVAISILAEIASHSPRVIPRAMRLISILIFNIDNDKKKEEIMRFILNKIMNVGDHGHLETWVQRVTYPYERSNKFSHLKYNERLCKVVKGESSHYEIWNNNWLDRNSTQQGSIIKCLEVNDFIDREESNQLSDKISKVELSLHKTRYHDRG